MQSLVSKSAEEAFLNSAKTTTGNTQLSFVLIRIDDANKWKSSLARKLTQQTMNSISNRLSASAGDVVLLGLGPRESLVSYFAVVCSSPKTASAMNCRQNGSARVGGKKLAPPYKIVTFLFKQSGP